MVILFLKKGRKRKQRNESRFQKSLLSIVKNLVLLTYSRFAKKKRKSKHEIQGSLKKTVFILHV